MARILIVEDHSDAARVFQILLESEGHEAQIANDGVTALDLFEACQPHFVFLDITLPDMDGYELAMKLRSHQNAIRPFIAALTGWGDLDAARLREVGIDSYLVKPVAIATVRQIIASRPLSQSELTTGVVIRAAS